MREDILAGKTVIDSGRLVRRIEEALKDEGVALDGDTVLRSRTFAESVTQQGQLHGFDEVLDWFERKRRDCAMRVRPVGLNELPEWSMDEKTATIRHRSGQFYCVMGVQVTGASGREVLSWSQPLLQQHEGGILGILCKRFGGVMHYLLQAKAEPGNVGTVLLSPTLQATWSNLRRFHGGKKTQFAEYFEEPDPERVIFSREYAEDGGRLYLKSNRNMLVEVAPDEPVAAAEDFIWVTLYQIKRLLRYDNLVNPHVRSIISYL